MQSPADSPNPEPTETDTARRDFIRKLSVGLGATLVGSTGLLQPISLLANSEAGPTGLAALQQG